ncbi:MAG: hypothetical protein ACTH1O_12460 [Brachybacterium sp.]
MTQPPSSPQPSGPLSPQHGFPAQGGMPSPGAPGPYGGASAAVKKPSKAPKILIILGSVILALSVIIGVVLAVIGIGGIAGDLSELEEFSGGSGTISADAGETYQIYAEEGAQNPTCIVDGPAVGEGTSQSSSISDGETNWVSIDSFTAEEAGEYSIDCSDGPIAVGPPVSIGGVFAGVGGVLLAIGGGALGFLLLAIGVILLIVRKRKA